MQQHARGNKGSVGGCVYGSRPVVVITFFVGLKQVCIEAEIRLQGRYNRDLSTTSHPPSPPRPSYLEAVSDDKVPADGHVG